MTPPHYVLFQRALEKIDRRIQNPAYSEVKGALWVYRKAVFDGFELEKLDLCLRDIDRQVKRRRS